jgi:glutaminase
MAARCGDVWSPRLDRFGNSVRGIAVCEELSRRLDGSAGQSRLATFSPGMCFGEIGFLTGQPRSADVVCTTGGSCWELGRGRFTGLQQRDPEAAMQLIVAILGELGVKLARTSLQLSLLEHH